MLNLCYSIGSGGYNMLNPSANMSYLTPYEDGYGGDKGYYGAAAPWAPNEPRSFSRH